jgi:ABC-type transport system involved in cytochrome bd biosynthesis fused ATPase/permease subunit
VARAILGDPALLIVDEIDANLDPQAAAVLDRVLDEFSGTILMVTRANSRLARADYFWHLDGGRLVRAEDRTQYLAAGGGGLPLQSAAQRALSH